MACRSTAPSGPWTASPSSRPPRSRVLSGSTIATGRDTARATRVGAGSFPSRIAADAKRFSLVTSEIRNSLNRILRWLTWALLPLSAASGWPGTRFSSRSWQRSRAWPAPNCPGPRNLAGRTP
ncbi:P-type ATPase [Pseudarthrobacter oxydans]|uniref:P-type ATPase n=1 Tax=Pseudarthrobacter oxydans TaxID=1671 RepID=UPI003520A1EB